MSASPFAERLNTNYVPSTQEIAHVKELVRDRKVIVDKLDEEIHEVEKVLAALNVRRSEHITYMEEHEALLSPIKRLPLFILSSIFFACLPSPLSTHTPRYQMYPEGQHPSVTLSHVCHDWRQVALANPLLWSTINIDPDQYNGVARQRQNTHSEAPNIEELLNEDIRRRRESIMIWTAKVAKIRNMAEEWITRSAQCPLHVGFRYNVGRIDGGCPQEVYSMLEQLVDLVCAVSLRWKVAEITLTTIQPLLKPLCRLLELPPSKVPLLETLAISASFVSEEHAEPLRTSVRLIETPSLRCLNLRFIWDHLFNLSVHWAGLTELILGWWSDNLLSEAPGTESTISFRSREALDLLKLCPNLVSCSLNLQFHDGSADSDSDSDEEPPEESSVTFDEPVSLLHLRSLTISGLCAANNFASWLNLPSLRALHILTTSHPRHEDNSEIIGFFKRYGEQLTEVTLRYPSLTQNALLYALGSLPNVTELTMAGLASYTRPSAKLVNSVIDRLTPTFDAEDRTKIIKGCFCPKLKKLHCKLREPEFSEEALLELLVARRSVSKSEGPVARIENVQVQFAVSKGLDIREEMIRRGVDMEDLMLTINYKMAQSSRHWALSIGEVDSDGYEGW